MLAQIMALDIVFSLDSVITAVGMAQQVAVMIAAVVVAVLVMMAFARAIDGFGHHVPKGYIYFAMAFSLLVEMLNLKAGHREPPVHLRQPYVRAPERNPLGHDSDAFRPGVWARFTGPRSAETRDNRP